MTPTSPPSDLLTSNLLIDPRWSSISQLYGSAQDLIEAEQRYSVQNEAGKNKRYLHPSRIYLARATA